jgi:hypothetical protein
MLEHAQEYSKQAKEAAQYKEKKQETKDERKNYKKKNLEIENDRNFDLRNARLNFSGSAREKELSRINKQYDEAAKHLKEEHETNLSTINTKYKEVGVNPVTGPVRKIINWGGKTVKGYDPNKIVNEALKKGLADISNAIKSLKALGRAPIGQFRPNSFGSANGNNTEQKEFFKMLAKKDKDSQGALEAFKAELNQIRNQPGGLKKGSKESINIENFKVGLANHLEDNKGDRGTFETILSELNEIDTQHKNGWKHIDDFMSKS